MKSDITLRPMIQSDLLFADSLRGLVGWNQTINDWKRLLALSPHGCFIGEWRGVPAGTATTICYGTKLAWIGMVLVHPDFRGRGIGRALLDRCLEYLRGCGVACIKLDATPQGKLLYDQLGFQEEWALTRWGLRSLPKTSSANCKEIRPYTESDADAVEQLDQRSFGVSRQPLLHRLLHEGRQALVHQPSDRLEGYGVLREGMRADYLGPVVAATPSGAALLIDALLGSAAANHIFWDIPDAQVETVALAKTLGFTAQRHLLRMFLGGNNHPGKARQCFAIADPSTG